MKKRTKLSDKDKADVLFRARHQCCMCRQSDPQIHHIDGNPSNNAFDNLAPIYPNCQDSIHTKRATTQDYTELEIKKYRDDWYRKVEQERQFVAERDSKTNQQTNNKNPDFLSALALHDVMLIHHEINFAGTNWDEIQRLLFKLPLYGEKFGYEVRLEILSAAHDVSDHARMGMPTDIIRALQNVVISASPIYSIVGPARREITKKDIALIGQAIEIGFALLYDACKHVRQLETIEESCSLLIFIQRYTQVNKLIELEKRILEYFATCENLCDIEIDSKKFIQGKEIIKKCREEYY